MMNNEKKVQQSQKDLTKLYFERDEDKPISV